jgi:hypothetical protein
MTYKLNVVYSNTYSFERSCGSSVIIVSDYRLKDWDSISGSQITFPVVFVQTSSEAHSVSYQMGSVGPLPRSKPQRG